MSNCTYFKMSYNGDCTYYAEEYDEDGYLVRFCKAADGEQIKFIPECEMIKD